MEIWTVVFSDGPRAVMCFRRHARVSKSARSVLLHRQLPSKTAPYVSDLELDMHAVFDDIYIKTPLLFYSSRFVNLEFVWSKKRRTVLLY